MENRRRYRRRTVSSKRNKEEQNVDQEQNSCEANTAASSRRRTAFIRTVSKKNLLEAKDVFIVFSRLDTVFDGGLSHQFMASLTSLFVEYVCSASKIATKHT